MAATGSAQWCIESVLTTRSTDSSLKGNAATSPTRKGGQVGGGACSVAVGAGPLDHCGIQVDPSDLEAVPAGEPDRQVPGSTTHLEHPGAGRGAGRDVGGDASVERPEHEPGHGVVGARVADQDPARDMVAAARAANVASYDANRSGGRERNDESARPGHDGSFVRSQVASPRNDAERASIQGKHDAGVDLAPLNDRGHTPGVARS